MLSLRPAIRGIGGGDTFPNRAGTGSVCDQRGNGTASFSASRSEGLAEQDDAASSAGREGPPSPACTMPKPFVL